MTKHIDKKVRAKAIQDLTGNGKKRVMVRKITNLMEDRETLAILNALFMATRGKND